MFHIVRKNTQNNQSAPPVLSEWEPFRMMENLLRNDAFADYLPRARTEAAAFQARFDVKETKDAFLFKADLPGLKEQDVDISLTGNRLTISGKRELDEQKEGENYYTIERYHGSFSRTFTLPESADTEKVKAEMKDGILSISLPKRAESQPRKITIGNKQ